MSVLKRLMVHSVILRVLSIPAYATITLVAFFIQYIGLNVLPNWQTFSALYRSDTGILGLLKLTRTLQGWLLENSSPIGFIITITTIFCSSVLFALIVYALRRKHFMLRSAGTSTLGMVSTLFGVGCLSCGSVVLSLLLPAAGVAAVRTYLPFHGFEFGPLGLFLVTVSLFLVIKDIDRPAVCAISLDAK
ncbi:MAG: hypothetical protein WAX38_01500 [Minisyncoccia bacterium]